MKKRFLLLALLASSTAFAQNDNVGIGTTKPDASAILDLNSSSKGFLTTRLSLTQRNAIKNPAQGLMVYQTDFLSGFYYFDGKEWKAMNNLNENSSVAGTDGDWEVGANIFSVGATPVLGTYSNNIPLKFVVNNQQSGLINPINENTFFGYFAGLTSTGGQNVGLGAAALQSNIGGDNNIAIGRRAMYNNTSGYLNVAIGSSALRDNGNGKYNIAIGFQALLNSTNDNNIAIGLDALKVTTGAGNTAIGTEALANNTTSSNNFALGKKALFANTLGEDNFALGNFALSKNLLGNNNLALGVNAGRDALGTGNIFIGFNAGLTESGANKLYISNSSEVNPLIKGDFSTNNLQVNSKSTGYLAIGDFTTAPSATAGTGGLPLPANIGAAGGYRLVVQDGILCEKVKVALRATGSSDWADYVFEPEYKAKMMSLEEVEKFTIANKHLPNVPSTEQVQKEGLDMHLTSKMFMEKIEELTLYMIEMNKEIKALKKENATLKNK